MLMLCRIRNCLDTGNATYVSRVIAINLRKVHSHGRLSSILTAVPCFRKGADSVSTGNIPDIHPSLVSNGTRRRDLQYSPPPKQVAKIGIAILSFSDNS